MVGNFFEKDNPLILGLMIEDRLLLVGLGASSDDSLMYYLRVIPPDWSIEELFSLI